MDHPVEIGFLGAFLIVLAAGIISGLAARWLRGTTALGTLFDIALATLGGFFLIFYLPMHGYALGNVIGWKATVVLAAVLPVAAFHMVAALRSWARSCR